MPSNQAHNLPQEHRQVNPRGESTNVTWASLRRP